MRRLPFRAASFFAHTRRLSTAIRQNPPPQGNGKNQALKGQNRSLYVTTKKKGEGKTSALLSRRYFIIISPS